MEPKFKEGQHVRVTMEGFAIRNATGIIQEVQSYTLNGEKQHIYIIEYDNVGLREVIANEWFEDALTLV